MAPVPAPAPVLSRDSHLSFFEARDWGLVQEFWRQVMQLTDADIPLWLRGQPPYTVTDLFPLHMQGKEEFSSKDPRYRRQTFALRIGYQGSLYHGYQLQHSAGSIAQVATVEGDLEEAIGRKLVAAGRTDKDVSAISQVLSFATHDPLTSEDILSRCREHTAFKENKLAIYQCIRVPRRFHALFSASWRRYVYLFPLQPGPYLYRQSRDSQYEKLCQCVGDCKCSISSGFDVEESLDVDVHFVQKCLQK
jgi:hypothetical protein